jgi:hypothetical protein
MTVKDNEAMITRFFEELLDKIVSLLGDLSSPGSGYSRRTFNYREAYSTLPRLPSDSSSGDRRRRLDHCALCAILVSSAE